MQITLHDQGEDAVNDRYSIFCENEVILLFNEVVEGLTANDVLKAIKDYVVKTTGVVVE